MNRARQHLLLEIARCPNVALGRAGVGPCASIVAAQTGATQRDHQVPEPWSGSLGAPILFISSNPSLDSAGGDAAEAYPTGADDDAAMADFFERRFEGDTPPVKDGRRRRLKNGSYGRATPFWSSVRARARELLGRDPDPGRDYALTEVVHCKSRSEIGVPEATAPCIKLYLQRLLELSEARVVVVLGAHAGRALRSHFGLPGEGDHHPPTASRACHVCFLPHPNARGMTKSFAPRVLEAVRPALDA